jgi:hypothetical protein
MRFFAAVDALPGLESMKFPVFSLLTGNFGLFRDDVGDVKLPSDGACRHISDIGDIRNRVDGLD